MRAACLLVVPVLALVAACGSSSSPKSEQTATNASPIINGVVDTTDNAVVAIAVGNQGLCSGTIVKVDAANKIGWVLTAAHCVEVAPVLAIQGSDFNDINALQYYVVDYSQDTRYQQGGDPGQPYDFAVIRIAGVD